MVEPIVTQTHQNSPQTASGLSPEAEDQFELELCWCIQELQEGLSKVNLQEKQVLSMKKNLNILKSQNASLIKKRQLMRNLFGDYRLKMSEDLKKFDKSASSVKFTKTKVIEEKSKFLKKASCSSSNDTKLFSFNFEQNADDE